MGFLAIFVLMLLVVFVLIAVHECGHFAAGELAGIPASQMSVRLFAFPQHVAVRDGDGWCSPNADMARYVELTGRHLTTRRAAFGYVAGGIIAEGLFTTLATLLFVGLQRSPWGGEPLGVDLWGLLAFWTPTLSLAMYLINAVLMDVPWAVVRRYPVGDTSGLWSIARGPAIVLSVLMLALRVGLVWYAAGQT